MEVNQLRLAVYTGSFDPITLGHLNVIRRASRLVDRLIVGVGINIEKEALFPAAERVAMLDLFALSPEVTGLSPLTIQQRHDQAFDGEAVTKRFFEEYARVFARVEGLIAGFDDPERKRLFTQRLFNRLMFIAFIQKKG